MRRPPAWRPLVLQQSSRASPRPLPWTTSPHRRGRRKSARRDPAREPAPSGMHGCGCAHGRDEPKASALLKTPGIPLRGQCKRTSPTSIRSPAPSSADVRPDLLRSNPSGSPPARSTRIGFRWRARTTRPLPLPVARSSMCCLLMVMASIPISMRPTVRKPGRSMPRSGRVPMLRRWTIHSGLQGSRRCVPWTSGAAKSTTAFFI